MGRFILGTACFFAAIPAATAQVQVSYRTYTVGCQRITDFVIVETVAPPTKGVPEVKGQADPKLVTLSAKEWKNGTQFKDGEGKMWRLVYGPQLQDSPNQLTGTLTHAADGRVLFLTGGGTLFMRVEL